MRRIIWSLALIGLLLLLPACGDSDNPTIDRDGFTAMFDLSAGVLPFPTNLLFSGSLDGTLNIPVDDPDDISDPAVAMNSQDGFSTVAPMSTTFSGTIDPATLTPETVRVFEVTLSGIGGVVTGINRELAFGTEFVATVSSVDPDGRTLVILPTAPLSPLTSYMAMLSDGIKSASGADPQISAHYLICKGTESLIGTPAEALEDVRVLVNYQEAALAGAGVDTDTVILSWTFSTQSVGVVLGTVKGATPTGSSEFNPTTPIGTTADFLPAGTSPGLAYVHIGTLDVPYYLTAAADEYDSAPLSTWWQGAGGSNLTWLNSTPVATDTATIPVLLTVPTSGSAPWPVVIFQHGITTDRSVMLATADTFALAGFAVVAIDLPLHGIAPPEPKTPSLYSGIERTFDLDLVDNVTGAPGPDGIADSSGTHFINLASLQTTRDNLRQAAADLFALTDALATMDYDDDGSADFNTDQIYFTGHSLGGMVGSVFLALEPDVRDAVLAMAGGGIAKLLDGSISFGPRIEAGLAAKGVIKGTPDYESFMGAAQTLIDSGDPINYTSSAIAGRGILMFEVLGDTVVPNNVMADAPEGTVPSPLAGTDPLAFFMGLTPVNETTKGSDLKALMRYVEGDHGSILDPTASLLTTQVMQNAMATFVASDGAVVDVLDGGDAVLE